MVSFHTPLSIPEFENSSKKRKWEEPEIEEVKPMKPKSTNKSIFDTELHHESPLPSEWQRCLDIKSGQIYFYNTRTQKRTSKDPRLTPEEPPSHGHMSLDLDLNLPCGSVKNHKVTHNFTMNNSMVSANKASNDQLSMNSSRHKKNDSEGLKRVPSWLAFEGDQREMITAVCKRCHMLVMMCKSSPSCPNCKFMHPPDQNPPSLFKQRLGLLC